MSTPQPSERIAAAGNALLDDAIAKPFDVKELLAAVRLLFGDQDGGRSLGAAEGRPATRCERS